MPQNPLTDAVFARHMAHTIAARRDLPSASVAPIADAILEFGKCLETFLDCALEDPSMRASGNSAIAAGEDRQEVQIE